MKYLTLFLVVILAGALALGCVKRRIEGAVVPVEAQPTETAVPTPAPPPPVAAVPTPAPPEAPPPPVAAEPTPTEAAPPPPEAGNPCSNYIVVRGDTLWDISAMDIAYKDHFQWPLIFKANRDQIKDPDLIYPKQEFCIRHDFTDADVEKARKDASDTPKYVPHTKPRETLPVDYF